jgi:multidrug resistance efflux pump
VHEIGALFLYFTPCFYCNVSDAWLFREKWKRVWVMLAGGHCDLLVWALAVAAWRLAEPGTFVSRVSFLVLGLSGLDSLSNFNPLLKLDGYYLLSDWKELPNLRQRALERVGAHARRLLWGAQAPEPDARGRFLTTFGLLTWLFSAIFLLATVAIGANWLGGVGGAAGVVAAGMFALPAAIATVRSVTGGEMTRMITKRRVRTAVWLLLFAGLGAAGVFWHVDEYSGGSFTIRPTVRAEVRAPVAGFLQTIGAQEGDRVAAGDLLARLEVPDLACRLEQKRAELREARAQRTLLETGTRPEAIADQRGRVERAGRWHALAGEELARRRKSLEEELVAFDQRLAEAQVQVDAAQSRHERVRALFQDGLVTREELEGADQARRIAAARLSVAQAEKRAREASGTIDAEAEVARRERDVGDETSKLALLEAGARPEELAAQSARIERLAVELDHLEAQERRLEVRVPVSGTIVTPHLGERCGEYLHEGDSICVVEESSVLEAEVVLDEEKLRGVEPGQRVRFKVRALPFETIEGTVRRVAACAARDESHPQGRVVVHCSIDGAPPMLRTATGGYARIYTGRRAAGGVVVDAAMRLLRTEFWW